MATLITGTSSIRGDDLIGTEGDDIIDAQAGPDLIRDFAGNDLIQPGSGDDLLYLGPGRDTIEIEPDDLHTDEINGFMTGEDTLVIKGFPTLDSNDDINPFFFFEPADGFAVLDLSGAAGGVSGNQTIRFTDTYYIVATDIVFAPGQPPTDPGERLATPVDRDGLPNDPSRFDLKPPPDEGVFTAEEGFFSEGPYTQPEQLPGWDLQ